MAGYTDLVGDQLDALLADDSAGYDVAGDGAMVVSGYDVAGDVSLVGAALAKSGLPSAQIANALRGIFGRGGAMARPAPHAPAQRPRPEVRWPGTMVEEKAFTKRRKFPLGLSTPIAVPAFGSAVIRVQPPQPFRPYRLVVGSDIAPRFLLTNFQIGKELQFMTPDPISAVTFQENAIGTDLECDTVQTSQQIILAVTNNTGAPSFFYATLLGVTVQG